MTDGFEDFKPRAAIIALESVFYPDFRRRESGASIASLKAYNPHILNHKYLPVEKFGKSIQPET